MRNGWLFAATSALFFALPSCALETGFDETSDDLSPSLDATDEVDGPIGTTQQGLTVSGMGHYCSMTWPTGGWAFMSYTAGGDPCGTIISQSDPGGTIRRAGVYSASGVNSVVARCDNGYVSIWVGVGNDPLTWAYNAAQGHSGCFFTVAPKYMPIFDRPFDPSTSITHGSGFDFARSPYNTLNVADFGQSGSTTATVVDWKGRDKSSSGFIDNHDAHDWNMPRGTPLRAVAAGVVRKARWFNTGCTGSDSSTQGEVYIDHTVNRSPSTYNEEFTTAYFHLQSLNVSDGQTVAAGDVIGWSGNTGCSSGPHLHFAVLRRTNTATNYHDTLTIDSSGNDGWRITTDPYGFDPPQGFDPWGWRAYGSNAGALSIVLWKSGQAPITGSW